MPDPISPMGSPGQLPNVAQTQTSNTPTLGAHASEAGGAPSSGGHQSIQAQDQQVVSLAIVSKKIPEKQGKEEKEIPTLEDATKTLKDYLKNLPSDLQFKMDEETGTVMFKVVNPVTKEVLQEFPPEEVVEMAKRLKKLGQQSQKSGLLFDTNS